MQAAFSRDRDENSLAAPFGTLAAPTSAGQQVLAPLSRCNPSGLVMLWLQKITHDDYFRWEGLQLADQK